MKKILLGSLGIVIMSYVIVSGSNVLADTSDALLLRCHDSIAGQSALVQTYTEKNADVTLVITTPTQQKIILNEVADSKGEIRMQIPAFHIKNVGTYSVHAVLENSKSPSIQNECTFTVLTDEVSKTKSEITVEKKTALANDTDPIYTIVRLSDAYDNPIVGHTVELYSSRQSDTIRLISKTPYTDKDGNIQFSIHSSDEGLSVLSALDTTTNIMIDDRENIAFLDTSLTKTAMGGPTVPYYNLYEDNNSIFLNSVPVVGQLHGFKVEMEETIEKNESASVTVSAVDELENVVPDYTGTIRFSSTDENAILPEDYTFTSNDLGVHEFSLGIALKSEGNHIIGINDLENNNIRGETEVSVIQGTNIQQDANKHTIQITSPLGGSYSKKEVIVKGMTTPATEITLFDSDVEVGTFTSDEKGEFIYTIANANDGTHNYYLIAYNTDKIMIAESESIELTIDTTPPELTELTFEPTAPFEPGAEVKIKIVSETNLSQSDVLINNTTVQLRELTPNSGLYTGSYVTEKTPGKFTVDVVLKDQLENEKSIQGYTQFEVKSSAPSKVSEISYREEDGRIVFTWAAAEDDTYITKYKIKYGTDISALTSEVVTKDSATTWYIPNLQNETPYYFSLSAIDGDGNEGESSDIVTATPKVTVVENASLGDPILLKELPTKTPDTGPEIWYILITSLFVIDIYLRHRKVS